MRTNRKAPRWGPPPPHVLEMIGFIGFIGFYAGFHLFLLVWIGFYWFSLGFLRFLCVFICFPYVFIGLDWFFFGFPYVFLCFLHIRIFASTPLWAPFWIHFRSLLGPFRLPGSPLGAP